MDFLCNYYKGTPSNTIENPKMYFYRTFSIFHFNTTCGLKKLYNYLFVTQKILCASKSIYVLVFLNKLHARNRCHKKKLSYYVEIRRYSLPTLDPATTCS